MPKNSSKTTSLRIIHQPQIVQPKVKQVGIFNTITRVSNKKQVGLYKKKGQVLLGFMYVHPLCQISHECTNIFIKLIHNFQKNGKKRQLPVIQKSRKELRFQVLTPTQCRLQWI